MVGPRREGQIPLAYSFVESKSGKRQTLADAMPLINVLAGKVPYFPPKARDYNHKNRPTITPTSDGSFTRGTTEIDKWYRIMMLVCQIFDRLFIRDPTKLAYEFADPVIQNEDHLWT